MKAIAIINLCVALLLTIVPNVVRTHEIIDTLNEIAKKGKTVDGIFKPSKNGFLGSGDLGVVYKGIFLLSKKTKVAMKFSHIDNIENSNREYEMYTYLGAIDNKKRAEAYGIPTIYYYGKWNDYNHTMLAMTLLNSTYQEKCKAFEMDELDILTALREFVRTIKYIHSCGVLHRTIDIENMIVHNDRGFIFDFGKAEDMAKYEADQNIQMARSDFVRFLNSVYEFVSKKSDCRWFGFSDKDAVPLTDILDFKDTIEEYTRKNGENSFTGRRMRRVFVEFFENSYLYRGVYADTNGTWIPLYDQLYEVIVEDLQNYGKETKSSDSSISNIPNPFGGSVWQRPDVVYDFFEEKYAKKSGCSLM